MGNSSIPIDKLVAINFISGTYEKLTLLANVRKRARVALRPFRIGTGTGDSSVGSLVSLCHFCGRYPGRDVGPAGQLVTWPAVERGRDCRLCEDDPEAVVLGLVQPDGLKAAAGPSSASTVP